MNWGRTEAQQRWFDEAERQEEERDRCKERAREQYSIEQLRAEVQREIAALREEMTRQSEVMFQAAGQALGDVSNAILDRVEVMVNKIESDLRQRFSEAHGAHRCRRAGCTVAVERGFQVCERAR